MRRRCRRKAAKGALPQLERKRTTYRIHSPDRLVEVDRRLDARKCELCCHQGVCRSRGIALLTWSLHEPANRIAHEPHEARKRDGRGIQALRGASTCKLDGGARRHGAGRSHFGLAPPPSAPDTVETRATSMPMADALATARLSWASVYPRSSASASSTPGNTPAEPAVGAATMRPIEAFVSSTAIAYVMARKVSESQMVPAEPSASRRAASPPMSPPIEGCGSRRARSTLARITEMASST